MNFFPEWSVDELQKLMGIKWGDGWLLETLEIWITGLKHVFFRLPSL